MPTTHDDFMGPVLCSTQHKHTQMLPVQFPPLKLWYPLAQVPFRHSDPSHSVQSEIETSVYVVEQSASRNSK